MNPPLVTRLSNPEGSLGHTYSRLLIHVIFSTKDRLPYLHQDRRDEIFDYLGGILRNLGCESLCVGGVTNHVHVVLRLSVTLTLAEVVGKLKGNSSKWIHEQRILPRAFSWQKGYAAFSVSESRIQEVLQYVANQESHHRRVTFHEEVIAFLRQNRISFDETSLWD
jgi:putative transposase